MASTYGNNAAPKRKLAKVASNQEGLDRLWERYDRFSADPSSRMVYTIRKAIKSLQACGDPITTNKEAKALHGVGDALARVIVKSKDKEKNAGTKPTDTTTVDTTTRIRKRKPPPPPTGVGCSSIEAPILSEKQKAYNRAVSLSKSLKLPKDNWKVVLLVDGREHHSKKVIAKLQMSGVPSEERHLPIGDMAWVAKSGTCEVMLGTIIERKEVHDLASSLFGTRYKEQRLRLQNCGLPQVFLLVEGDTKDVSNCPHDTLQMAMMETRIELGFQVVQTRHLEDTVRFLKSVHRRILQRAFPSAFAGETMDTSLPTFSSPSTARRRAKKRRRRSIQKRSKNDRRSFEEMIFDNPPEPPLGTSRFISYQELKCKVEKDREEGTKTINAIFCGMLKQIPKVSNATVQTLAQAYPTPDALFRALDGLNVVEGKNMLSDLGADSKKVGEQKALQVYHTFMAGDNDDIVVEHSSSQRVQPKAKSPKNQKNVLTAFKSKETSPAKSGNRELLASLSKNDSWDDLWQNLKEKGKEAEVSNVANNPESKIGIPASKMKDACPAKPAGRDFLTPLSNDDSFDVLWRNLNEKTNKNVSNANTRPIKVAGAGIVDLLESDEESTKLLDISTHCTMKNSSLHNKESELLTSNTVEKQRKMLHGDKESTSINTQDPKQCVTNNDISIDESEDELKITNTSANQHNLLESGKKSTKSLSYPKSHAANEISLDESEDELLITNRTTEQQTLLARDKKGENLQQVPNQKIANEATVEDSDDDLQFINKATKKRKFLASESSVSSWDVTPFVARRRQHQNLDTEFQMDNLAMSCPTTDSGCKRQKNQHQQIVGERGSDNNVLLIDVSRDEHQKDLSSQLSFSSESAAKKPRPSPASTSSISSWDVTPFAEQRRRGRVKGYPESSVDVLVRASENTSSPYKTVTREVSISDDDSTSPTSPKEQEVIELLD